MQAALRVSLLTVMVKLPVKFVLTAVLLVSPLVLGSLIALKTTHEPYHSLEYCETLAHGPSARDCYVKVLSFKDEKSLDTTLSAVNDMMLDRSRRHFQVECHEVTHELGKMAAAVVEDYHRLYTATEDSSCMSGFQHGLLEAELATMTDDELSYVGQSICDGKLREFNRCVHLLGHIAAQRSDLTEAGMDLARRVCGRKLVHVTYDSAFHEFRCYDGVYMEITLRMRRTSGQVGPGFSKLPAEHYCASLRNDHDRVVESSACIHQVSTILVSETGYTPETLQRCARLSSTTSASFGSLCMLSAASFMGTVTDDPVALSSEICPSLGQYGRTCFSGFARSYGNMSGLAAAEEFCRRVLPEDLAGCLDVSTPFEYNSPVGIVSALDMVQDLAAPVKVG